MAITWDVWHSLPNPLQWCCFPTLYSTKRTGVTSNPFRLRLHSWKGNVSTWTNSPWYSFFGWDSRFHTPQILSGNPERHHGHGCQDVSICFYLQPAFYSELLRWCPKTWAMRPTSDLQISKHSTGIALKSMKPRLQHIKIYQSTMTIKYYKVLVFLLYSHTHLTHLSWSLANSQASGRTPMSQQGRNAAWILVCRY